MSDKKLRERRFIEEVASIYSDFPPGIIENHERPDFLISQNDQVVGIEVVDYIRGQSNNGSPQRRNEHIWQKIADVAQAKYSASHKECLLMNFLLNSGEYPNRSEMELLANSAVSIVSNYIPQKIFGRVRIDYAKLEGTPLYKYVISLHIMRVRNDKESLWSYVDSDFVTLHLKEIEWLISSKDVKVDEYLKRCSRVWLVIVADGQRLSSDADLSEDILKHSFISRFHRVLFYNRLDQRVFPLVIA